jgi:predicted nucleic acid-binding protein
LIDLLFADPQVISWFKHLTKKYHVSPVGNEAILLELLKNSKSKKDYDKKALLYVGLVDADLPLDVKAIEAAQEMAIAYGSMGKDPSFADFILAGSIKRYNKTYLLTANHKDFPIEIMDRVSNFSLEIGSDVRGFAIYGYSEAKYLERLRRLGF